MTDLVLDAPIVIGPGRFYSRQRFRISWGPSGDDQGSWYVCHSTTPGYDERGNELRTDIENHVFATEREAQDFVREFLATH